MNVELRGVDVEIGQCANRSQLITLIRDAAQHRCICAQRMRAASFTKATLKHGVFRIEEQQRAGQDLFQIMVELRELLKSLPFTNVDDQRGAFSSFRIVRQAGERGQQSDR